MERHVGQPDIVLAIDCDSVRHCEVVGPERPQQFSVRSVEDEDGWIGNRFSWQGIVPSSVGAVENVDFALGVDVDAGAEAEAIPNRCGWPILLSDVVGVRGWPRGRVCGGGECGEEAEEKREEEESWHGRGEASRS